MVEYWKKAVIALGIGCMNDGLDWGWLMTWVTVIKDEIPFGPVELGWLLSLPGYFSILYLLGAGPLVDKWGRKKFLVLGNLITMLTWIVIIFSTVWWHLALCRLVAFIGTAFTITTSFTTIAEEAPPDKRQTVSSMMGAFQIGGMILSSFLFSLASIGLTWRMYAILLVIFNAVVVALMQFVVRDPPVWVERRKLMLQQEKEGVKTGIKEEISYKGLVKSLGIKLVPLLIIGIAYSASSIITATGQYGAWYLRTVLNFSPGIMGLMGMIGPWFYILIRFISGRVSDRIGRLNTLILFNIIGLIFNQLMWRTHLLVGVGEVLPVIAFYYVTNWMAYFQGWGVEDAGRLPLMENVPTAARATAENLKEALKSILISLELTAAGYMAATLAPEIAYAIFPIIGSIIGLAAVFSAKKMGLESKGKKLT